MAHTFIINIHLLTLALSSPFLCFLFSSFLTSLFCTGIVSFVVPANLKPPSLFLFLPCLHVQQTIDVPMRHLYKQSGCCKPAPWQERCSFCCVHPLNRLPDSLLVYIESWVKVLWKQVNEFSVLKMFSPTDSTCTTKPLCGPILNITEHWTFDRSIAFSYVTLSLSAIQYFNTFIQEWCFTLIL